MKSDLDPDTLYVICLRCAMAEIVRDRDGGITLMKSHEGVQPGHRMFHLDEKGPVSVQYGWGSTLNTIARAMREDQREISVYRLERM